MRKLPDKWHKWCVGEKGHLVVGGGYLLTLVWGGHNSALMAGVYGTAALMTTHKIYRGGRAGKPELRHERGGRHLARD